ncbi:DUF5302 domain-containing protein [Nakamurella endophytica]|uniref:DUF5302 domain-containing protein n=1 Tax=Nakamurella endophytica TaxID=1748367 RepID=A0A917SX59_9ACTN|nr:DUF5302 domain-containing protein [Nakamurella endophytica]GGM02180.1 hypothetical protein GCM10011594_22840 [Nakamurella endophytica]
MADEHGDTAPEHSDGDTGQASAEAPTDPKAAFRAVLARKQQAAAARSSHLDGHGGVGGATANHKATRTFRRKSG